MLQTGSLSAGSPRRGIRRLNVRTDLAQIADLLDLAFQEEKRDSPVAMQASFSSVKGLAPVLWLVAPFTPGMSNITNGFVWYEDGRVVGNINVSRTDWNRSAWLIGNVAVHPTYRRRGIGRQLVQAALESVAAERGRLVVLDVREDNERAYRLYQEFGFTQRGGSREYYLPGRAARWATVDTGSRAVLQIEERVSLRDAWMLQKATTPEAERPVRPLRRSDFSGGLGTRIANWLSVPLLGQAHFSIGVRDGGRLVGWAGGDPAPGRVANRLRVVTDPAVRGSVETPLIADAVIRLQAGPSFDCWANIRLEEAAAADALVRYGFQPVEILHRLVREL